ncbi:MAG TPA: ABC transporter permease [Streptosporangiaceae bacterium]|jgi:ABC-2 type transport system permease protein
MNMRQVRAIFRKEMREFRRNKQIISTMAVSPIGFLIAPMIFLFSIGASDASTLYNYPVLLFTLGMAALVPVTVGAYSITGEREQGTLEPVLGTPIGAREFMLGKALSVFVPGVAESYLVFGVIDGLVWAARPAAVSAVALRLSILLAQLIFTPLLVCLSVWMSMMLSARVSDVRTAQQLGALINLPVIFLAIAMGFHLIPVTLTLGVTAGATLIVLDVAGWWLVSGTFDRERLILGAR